ncbi:MAG: hypothetical protein IJD48_01815 [Clostridia bacterium]|nr:hypothetical protein [Clostridia bacterium]
MTSKKKLIITLTTLSMVLLASVFSVVIIFAALNVTFSSGFSIRYTAFNVSADVTGYYFQPDGLKDSFYTDTTRTETVLSFDDNDDGIYRNFASAGELTIDYSKPLFFHYLVENTGDEDSVIYVYTDLSFSPMNFNINVDLTKDNYTDSALTTKQSWGGPVYPGMTPITLSGGETAHLYVKVQVSDLNANGYISGNMGCILSSTIRE